MNYDEHYNDFTKKDATLDSVLAFEYSEGKFVSEITAATKDGLTSDILDIKDAKGQPLVGTVYLLTSDFGIDLKVTVNGKEFNHREKIIKKVYFADTGVSLAPLYSEEDAEYFIIYTSSNNAEPQIIKRTTVTVYDKDAYSAVTAAKAFAADTAAENLTMDGAITQEYTSKYSFRSAIDNAALLYAIRGVKPQENATKNLNVISSAYQEPVALAVKNNGAAEKSFTINYNGAPVTETIKYDQFSFAVNKTNASGVSQYVSVQSADTETFKNSLLLEYAEPLSTQDSYLKMGALVFTLTSVTVN